MHLCAYLFLLYLLHMISQNPLAESVCYADGCGTRVEASFSPLTPTPTGPQGPSFILPAAQHRHGDTGTGQADLLIQIGVVIWN